MYDETPHARADHAQQCPAPRRRRPAGACARACARALLLVVFVFAWKKQSEIKKQRKPMTKINLKQIKRKQKKTKENNEQKQ